MADDGVTLPPELRSVTSHGVRYISVEDLLQYLRWVEAQPDARATLPIGETFGQLADKLRDRWLHASSGGAFQ